MTQLKIYSTIQKKKEQKTIFQVDLVNGGQMRLRFEEKLNNLDDLLIEMGQLVTGSIENAIKALEEKDVELAKEVYEADAEINKMEAEIESLALTILLT